MMCVQSCIWNVELLLIWLLTTTPLMPSLVGSLQDMLLASMPLPDDHNPGMYTMPPKPLPDAHSQDFKLSPLKLTTNIPNDTNDIRALCRQASRKMFP